MRSVSNHRDNHLALAKRRLRRIGSGVIKALGDRGLTQTQAAEILGVSQPKISALRNGQLDGFSTERLIRFLNVLGRDARIVVTAKPRSRPRLTIQAA
jgi:predicted XRE-type DNA-binding protein